MSGMSSQDHGIDLDALARAAGHLRSLKYEIRRWFIASELAANVERELKAALGDFWKTPTEEKPNEVSS